MSAIAGSETGDEADAGDDVLDEGTIHDVLRNDRRRLGLEALRESGGVASVSDIAETVAARESRTDPPPRKKRQSVYVSLHQTHLPKLASLDIVSYDSNDRDVELCDRIEDVEVYMEVVPEYGLSWGEFYFGWGVLGLLAAIAVRIGVPVLSAFSPMTVSGLFFVGLMVASSYHVYTQQDRILFHRLLE